MTTKISRIDRLPNLLSNGTPLAGFARTLRYYCTRHLYCKDIPEGPFTQVIFVAKLNAIFVTVKLHLQYRTCKPASISERFSKHGNFEQQFRYSAGAHVLFWFGLFILFRFASVSFCFVSILFCFVLFYNSAKTATNVNKLKKQNIITKVNLIFFSLFY